VVCIPFARSAAVAGVLTLLVGASGSVHAAPARHRLDTRTRTSTTLIYGTDQEPDTLNRLITQLETSANILAGVMETLVQSDAHDNFVPDLATCPGRKLYPAPSCPYGGHNQPN